MMCFVDVVILINALSNGGPKKLSPYYYCNNLVCVLCTIHSFFV